MSSNVMPENKKQKMNPENFTLISSSLEQSIKKDLKHITQIKFDKHIIGKLAILTGIISFFPIMYKMWITKNHSNFTWGNLCLALFSNAMWFYYGNLTSSSANLWSGTLFFIIYSYILVFKILY